MKKIMLLCMIFLGVLLPFSTADAFGGKITSPYGWRMHPVYHVPKFHAGVDIGDIPIDTPIPSLVTGTVAFSGWISGYGNYIAVKDDATGHYICFAHCNKLFFDVGTRVNEGQAIATVGNTGIGTGEHIHVEIRIGSVNGDTIDPTSFVASKWSLDGWDGTSGSIYDFFVPNISIDYSEYFAPSEELMKITKDLLTTLSATFGKLQEAMPYLLYALIILDLAWLMCRSMLGAVVAMDEVITRFFRYCFYIMAFQSWELFVREVFIPFFEQVGSTYAGRTFEEADFLKFDKLFTSVTNIIGDHIKPTLDGKVEQILPFVVDNVLVIVLLIGCLSLSFWVMVKLVIFYLICIFGILGIPLAFIPGAESHAKNMLGSVMVHAIDLILTCFLFGLLMNEIESFAPIPADSISSMLLFTGTFLVCAYFMGSDLRSASKMFERVLN